MTTQPRQTDHPTTRGYRKLRFRSIAELRTEIDRLVAADQAGTLRRSGQWTTGQIFGHLAVWIEYHFTGYPTEVHPPRLLRAAARMLKPILLRRPMRRGLKIPGVKGGTVGTEPMSTEEGAERLHTALTQLERGEPSQHHSPMFGPLNDSERIALHLRHAECHLGFLSAER